MQVNIRQIYGPWDLGYSLDKHTIKSIYLGDNEYGRPQFDTTRSEVGEALFKLKYRNDYSQVPILAAQMAISLRDLFRRSSIIVPMPPSRYRPVQPVTELARYISVKMNIPLFENLLVKLGQTTQMKDMASREDRILALSAVFSMNDVLPAGKHNVLLIDDLFDTGSSLEAATKVLRNYQKIEKIFVATLTRKTP